MLISEECSSECNHHLEEMERLSLGLVTSALPWIHVATADQFASSRKYAGPHSICQQYCHKCREHSETLTRLHNCTVFVSNTVTTVGNIQKPSLGLRTKETYVCRVLSWMALTVRSWVRIPHGTRMCVHVFSSFVTSTVMGRTPNKKFWKMSKFYVSRRIHFESERARGRGSWIIRPLIRPMYIVRDGCSMLRGFLKDTVRASHVIQFPMEPGERTGGKAVVAY